MTKLQNTGLENTGNYNTGNRNTGDYNTGDRNTGYCNTGYYNTGYCNTGNRNTGNYNTGDRNSGFFNSNSPKVRLFNSDSNLDFDSEIITKLKTIIFENLKTVCVWVETEKMTEEEKSSNPSHTTTGGYLKKRDYKYCWQKFWEKITEEEKNFIQSLPNFSWEIFSEITGITNQVKKKVTLELTDEQLLKIEKLLKE